VCKKLGINTQYLIFMRANNKVS
jgi:hypothetical protein